MDTSPGESHRQSPYLHGWNPSEAMYPACLA
jgi:hypothetical protein